MWKNTDPRLMVNGNVIIVILRPSLAGHGTLIAGIGEVWTHHGYYIATSFEDYALIDSDADWNPDWLWAFGP